jgi:hypothetical protein
MKTLFLILLFLLPGCVLETEDMPHDYKPGPATPVLEPQQGDWSSSNFWGDQFTSKRDAAGHTNFPKSAGQVLGVLPKNNKMYGPPKTVTVNLYRSDEPQIGNADFRARVTYGVGGASNQFLCDWLAGTQFSITANNVSVDAVSYAPDAQSAYAPDNVDGFFLGAMVTEGASPSVGLTYTEPLQSVTTGNVLNFDAPDFAKRIMVHSALKLDYTAPTGIFLEFISGGVLIAEYDLRVMGAYLDGGILIPGGCRHIRLANASGGTVYLAPQWVLGI